MDNNILYLGLAFSLAWVVYFADLLSLDSRCRDIIRRLDARR